MPPVLGDPTRSSVPIVPTSRSRLRQTLDTLPVESRAYASATGFDGAPGAHLIVPNAKGAAAAVLFGLAEPGATPLDPMAFGKLASLLPRGRYRIADGAEAPDAGAAGEVTAPARRFSARRFRWAATAR